MRDRKQKPLADLVGGAMPFSEEAEKGTLSCFLQKPKTLLNDAHVNLPTEAFYHPANRQLYEVLLDFNKRSIPIDLITLSSFLLDKQLMDKIGGPAALPELLSFVPTEAHYEHYKQILLEKYRLRAVVTMLTDGVQKAYQYDQRALSILNELESGMDKLRKTENGGGSFQEQVDKYAEEWEAKASGKKSSFTSSRWAALNDEIGGIPQGYVLIMGPRKGGKSSLMLNVASDFSIPRDDSKPEQSLVISYEMPEEQLIGRLLSDRFDIHSKFTLTPDLFPPPPQTADRIARAIAKIRKAPIKIISDASFTVDDICAEARLLDAKFVGVDYLQLMPPPPGMDRKEKKNREVEENSQRLCRLSLSLRGTVMILSQLNQDGEASWSSGTENDATLTMKIEEDGLYVKTRRGGVSGMTIPIRLNGAYYRFEEHEKEDKPKRKRATTPD